MSRKAGIEAEKNAANFLSQKGYRILTTNFTSRMGEIDIIAEKNGRIIFIEVKMRSSSSFGTGREYVTSKKLQKIILTAQLYMQKNKLTNIPFQIDVVEVQGEQFTHLENVTL